jgi:hypothetical protein
VVEVFGAMTQVFRWSDSGERPEIMVEMRLIKIPMGERHIGPINVTHIMNIVQQALEALNAAKQFRS